LDKPTGIVITTTLSKTPSWVEDCTKFGQLIQSKIKVVATSCEILGVILTDPGSVWFGTVVILTRPVQ